MNMWEGRTLQASRIKNEDGFANGTVSAARYSDTKMLRIVSKTVLRKNIQDFIYLYFYRNMFRPIWWSSSGESYKILKEVAISTTIRLRMAIR
jgi:hypothetical protein